MNLQPGDVVTVAYRGRIVAGEVNFVDRQSVRVGITALKDVRRRKTYHWYEHYQVTKVVNVNLLDIELHHIHNGWKVGRVRQ